MWETKRKPVASTQGRSCSDPSCEWTPAIAMWFPRSWIPVNVGETQLSRWDIWRGGDVQKKIELDVCTEHHLAIIDMWQAEMEIEVWMMEQTDEYLARTADIGFDRGKLYGFSSRYDDARTARDRSRMAQKWGSYRFQNQ
jgi:hypothetical protein